MIRKRVLGLTLSLAVLFTLYWGVGGACGWRPDNLQLIRAARDGDLQEVRHCLRWGADPNTGSLFGRNEPLGLAAQNGHATVVQALLQASARPNVWSGAMHYKPPLVWAALGGHSNCVKLLLDAGADTTMTGCEGGTALAEAASLGHLGIAKLLIAHGASINDMENGGSEALVAAVGANRATLVRLLLARGANPDTHNENGTTVAE
ncbi:MAG TPA: ankyrin repeat domain-containing protein, partial [Armatimonadota bacterium]|nr:ankyrin repeat domain-containing protein [Armatimonadota bacterium]